jgi:hypothetical protein
MSKKLKKGYWSGNKFFPAKKKKKSDINPDGTRKVKVKGLAVKLELGPEDGTFSSRSIDSKGDVISKKKRLSDTNNINDLLSSSNGVKLSLQQYRKILLLQAREVITSDEREFLINLNKK